MRRETIFRGRAELFLAMGARCQPTRALRQTRVDSINECAHADTVISPARKRAGTSDGDGA